ADCRGATHELEGLVLNSFDGSTINSLAEIGRYCRKRHTFSRDKLRDARLMVSAPAKWLGIGLPLALVVLVIWFGVHKIGVGMDRHRPVVFLVMACVATGAVGLVAFARPLLRTTAGDAYLEALKKQYQPLKLKVRTELDAVPSDQLAMAL